MIRELVLKNFKSFAPGAPPPGVIWFPAAWPGAKVNFGGLSLIIGTNASGKSNIRDGLRFMHGVSRGYALADVIGVKYVESGVLQWKGVRGGLRETVTRNGSPATTRFRIAVRTELWPEDGGGEASYSITVDVGDKRRPPAVAGECLKLARRDRPTFDWKGSAGAGLMEVHLRRQTARKALGPVFTMRSDRPALTQILELSGTEGQASS